MSTKKADAVAPGVDEKASAAGPVDESLKLRLGCCSGLHFLDAAAGICPPGVDPRQCINRNVCCRGRKIRFRDTEGCI